MNRGLYGLLINRRLEGQAKESVIDEVNRGIQDGSININIPELNLEVYEIPDSDFSATSGTVNLPNNGKWLLVGIFNSLSGNMQINGTGIVATIFGTFPISIQINGASFTYSKGTSDTVFHVRAILLGDP
jgi:hypothetical protein